MEEKYQNMLFDLLVAGIILFIIMLPRFCFRVDENEYKRVKEQYDKKIKEEQMEELKKFLAENPKKFEWFLGFPDIHVYFKVGKYDKSILFLYLQSICTKIFEFSSYFFCFLELEKFSFYENLLNR